MSIQIHINHLKQNVQEGLTATINKWSIKSYLKNDEEDTDFFSFKYYHVITLYKNNSLISNEIV